MPPLREILRTWIRWSFNSELASRSSRSSSSCLSFQLLGEFSSILLSSQNADVRCSSRIHIPAVYHNLMTEETSLIIDFYPLDFEIDMNGSTRSWQGVALLPFIDEKRLLEAMKPGNGQLSEEEQRRNTWGSSSLFISDEHPLFNSFCELYTKKRRLEVSLDYMVCSTVADSLLQPVDIDTTLSGGLPGKAVKDPNLLPGSIYSSPLSSVGLPDIANDRSLSVLYYFPRQTSPHKSVLLPGIKRAPRVLDPSDIEFTRAGREYNPNSRERRGRDNNYATQASLGRGGYNSRSNSGPSYGAGGYQESTFREGPRYPPSTYPPQDYHNGYSVPPPRSYHDYRGPPSYEGNRGSQYGGYNGPPPRGGRGGQPPHANHGYNNPYQGQGRGRGGRGYY